MKKTLLLVFIHGFKGSDSTFGNFPRDIRTRLAAKLPKIDVLSIQYPQYETRGDLRECVSRFREWLQNKVIDLEVLNRTPSPTVDPSVHVILLGHSMGGIVAAETLLTVVHDEPVPAPGWNSTEPASGPQSPVGAGRSEGLQAPEQEPRASSAPPGESPSRLLFPYVRAILAFDTPFLGISPGVLAFGAEERLNQASSAYKTFNSASELFGLNSPRTQSPQPIPNASSRGLPAPNGSNSGWGSWGKYAMYGSAAAAIAGVAGAAYLNWNQINQGLAWASSHLEFVGCLARGAELQKRAENLVRLTETHDVGFADFYTALSEKVTRKTQYAGAVLGQERTFCVIPKDARATSPVGTKRSMPSNDQSMPKRRKTQPDISDEMKESEKVREYAEDTSRSKGRWVKCVNDVSTDEVVAHKSMFDPALNPAYKSFLLPKAKEQILDWIDWDWYEGPLTHAQEGGTDDAIKQNTGDDAKRAEL